jgi:hypothetical protein
MASNFHELPTRWTDSHGTHLISGLRLLGRRFDSALIPNSLPYARMVIPWGSHPVTDPHLGGLHFRVVDDGGECTRFDKAALIAQWPEAMRCLRVCFENPGSHTNCCRCEKCVRTMLAFRVAGCPSPPAFPRDVTDRQIRRIRFIGHQNERQWLEASRGAAAHGLAGTSWAKAILTAIRRNRRRRAWKHITKRFIPLRNRVRVMFRGSPLSRRELSQQEASAPELSRRRS